MAKYTIRLRDFAPDLNTITPDIITDGNVIPSPFGFSSKVEGIQTGVGTFVATPLHAVALFRADNLQRIMVATADRIYDTSGSVNGTDQSKTSTGYATADAGSHWRFAQFVNTAFAVNKANPMQSDEWTSAPGAFTDVSGGPSAQFIESVNQFIIVANTATSSSQWVCSALGNPLDWVPSITTQCATGEITSVSGPITGLKRFGDEVVIYKARAMFLGRYVGAANNTWAFEKVPEAVGTLFPESIVDLGHSHVFLGPNDFYIYDGTRPIAIPNNIAASIFATAVISSDAFYHVKGLHDPLNSRVFWFYRLGSEQASLIRSMAVVWNYKTNTWGRMTTSCLTPVYNQQGGTFSIVPQASIYMGDRRQRAITETQPTTTSNITLSEFGDSELFTTLLRVIPKWKTAPLSVNLDLSCRDDLTLSSSPRVANASASNGRFDVSESARWHKINMDCTGPWELTEIDVVYERDGTE